MLPVVRGFAITKTTNRGLRRLFTSIAILFTVTRSYFYYYSNGFEHGFFSIEHCWILH